MVSNETPPPFPDPVEEKLLRRLRLVTIGVILVLLVLDVVVDTLGRLLIDPNFHSSEAIVGMMFGALTILLGVEGFSRFMGGRK